MNHRIDGVRNAFAAKVALTAIAAALALPAAAQEDDQPEQARVASGGGGDIVVTARRRDESLQDVPVAISAFDGARLEAQGVRDITQIADTLPNVTLEAARGTTSTLVAYIRGVGQLESLPGFEPGVGLYVDDVYIGRPQGAILDVYDTERVEVLRGPQGTLYGRNTIGGAIKYVPRRLGSDRMMKLRATGGTYGQREVVATIAVPLTPGLSIGGTGAYIAREGYGDNLSTGKENGSKDILAGRLSAEYDNADVFIRLAGDYTEDRSSAFSSHREITGLVNNEPVLKDVYDTRSDNGGRNFGRYYGGSLRIEVQATDELAFRNITAYRKNYTINDVDFDGLPVTDLNNPVVYGDKQFTQELQAVYESRAVSGLLGAYYIDSTATLEGDTLLYTTLDNFNANILDSFGTKSWSIFGDFTFDMEEMIGLPGVELSLGGRYTSDKRDGRVLRRTFLTGRTPTFGGTATVPAAVTSDFDGSAKYKKFSPRVSLAWKPSRDHNLYASYSQGFKAGNFDPRGQTSIVRARPGFPGLDLDGDGVQGTEADVYTLMRFEPEIIDTYEIGWKAAFADGRIRSNLAAFYSDYTNVQITGSTGALDPITGLVTPVSKASNAGAARIYGIEWEGSARLGSDALKGGDRVDLSWSAGWIDAKFTEYMSAVDGVITNIAKYRVFPNTPKYAGSVTLDYEIPVAFAGSDGSVMFSNSAIYRSYTYQTEIPSAVVDQPKYAIWNASLVWTRDDAGLRLGVNANNILDKRYRTSGYTYVGQNLDGSYALDANGHYIPTLGTNGVMGASYGAPRTVSAFVQFQF
ncbi:MAG: TonB-dependent receptor [Sphingobium sp.]